MQLVNSGKGANPPLAGAADSLLPSGGTGFFDLLAGLMLGSESDQLSRATPQTDGFWMQHALQSNLLIGSHVSTIDDSPDELARSLPTTFPVPFLDLSDCMKGIADGRPAEEIPLEPVPHLDLPECLKGIADGRPVEEIPLELVISPDESAKAQIVDPAIRELFEFISATLQIISRTDMQSASKPNETEPNIFLRLETADMSVAIPVEIAADEGKSIVSPQPNVGVADVTISTDSQPLRLELAANQKAILTGTVRQAIEEGIPREKLQEIVSRPEIAVRQVVLVTDPAKFLKQFMPEVVLPEHQQNALSRQSDECVSTTNDSDATKYSSGDQGRNQFTESHRDVERPIEKRILQPNKLDVQRLVRETGNESEHSGRKVESAPFNEYEARLFDLVPKQNPSSQTVNQTATGLKGDNQKVFVEPVRFKVHLPDSGLKITEVSSFKVSLKPESLGNVKVHLIMVDNQLTARLSVESTAARQAVESNLPILRDALEQNGIKVENFSVDIASGGNPNRQRNSRRDAPQVKQSTEEFSLDGDVPEPISIEAMRVASGGNLMGTLNLVA
jgi:hypothetical protein